MILIAFLCVSSVIIFNVNAFDLQFQFGKGLNANQQTVFTQAANKWTSIITGSFGSTITIKAGTAVCNQQPTANDVTVTDMLVFADSQPIDGVGGANVQVGVCGVDNANNNRLGFVLFDSADIANLQTAGTFNTIVLREFALHTTISVHAY